MGVFCTHFHPIWAYNALFVNWKSSELSFDFSLILVYPDSECLDSRSVYSVQTSRGMFVWQGRIQIWLPLIPIRFLRITGRKDFSDALIRVDQFGYLQGAHTSRFAGHCGRRGVRERDTRPLVI